MTFFYSVIRGIAASGLPLLVPQAPLSAHEVEQRLGLLQVHPGGGRGAHSLEWP